MLGLAAGHAHRSAGRHLARAALRLAVGLLDGRGAGRDHDDRRPRGGAVVPGRPEATVRAELGALRRPQVLLTLLVGIVGFGGMFALYSYIAPVATEVAGLSRGTVPLVLLVYGAGGVLGTTLGGRLADVALFRSLVGTIGMLAVLLAAVALTATWPAALFAGVFLVSVAGSALAILLQMRLMETAGDAQMLGAALNHSALNLANALGAWLGGLVIAAGFGYRVPSAVGAGLAVIALLPLGASAVVRARAKRAAARPVTGRRPADAVDLGREIGVPVS